MKATIPFGEYLPDQPALNSPGTPFVSNALPTAGGYAPLSGFSASGATLTARCQGAFACRDSAGNVHAFAGDATKLYKQTSNASFTDVSRLSGGAYATPADLFWSFAQYGDYVIATNQFDVPQYFQLGVSSNFEALPGSPINATCVATIRDFVFFGNGNTIQWSARDNPFDYTYSPLTESDSQILPDGGNVLAIVGGEYGYVFQDSKIRRLTYRGDQAIFQVDVVADNLGLIAPGAIASFGTTVLFLAESGFYALSGQGVRPIGVGKVDRSFWLNVDRNYLHRITSTIDPVNKIWVIAYTSTASLLSQGRPTVFLIYNYEVDRWSFGTASGVGTSGIECFYKSRQLSLTLEDLDAYGTLDTLPYSLDSDVWKRGGQQLAFFGWNGSGNTSRLYLPSGSIASATFLTKELPLNGNGRVLIRGARPLIEVDTLYDTSGPATGTVRVNTTYRTKLTDSALTTVPVVADDDGFVPLRLNTRYVNLGCFLSLSKWKNAIGVEVDYEPAGER